MADKAHHQGNFVIGPILLPSPCLCSHHDSRVICWHGHGARRPIVVIDSSIICYEIGDSVCSFHFADSDLISWPHHRPEFWRSIMRLEKKLRSSSDSSDSHGIYDVHLGLYPYLQDGSRSRLEIKVEFHEGVVPLSALLACHWHRLAFFLSLVWCLCYIFVFTFS